MSPSSFEGRLRDQLLDGLPAHRRRRRRRDRALAGLGVVALMVAVGLGVAASSGGDAASTERTDTRPVAPTTTSPTTAATTPTDPGPVVLPDVPLPEGPPLLARATPSEAVTAMLAALRDGDTVEAASHWTGYPEVLVLPDVDVVAEKVAALDALASAAPWVLDPAVTTSEGDTSVFEGGTPDRVVTVTAATADGPRALAFVTARDESGAGWVVSRAPTAPHATSVTPTAGSTVTAGSTIVFATSPVEGGARAYVDGMEVPVEDDRAAMEVRVTLPADVTGPITLTLALATPELPDALAVTYTVVG